MNQSKKFFRSDADGFVTLTIPLGKKSFYVVLIIVTLTSAFYTFLTCANWAWVKYVDKFFTFFAVFLGVGATVQIAGYTVSAYRDNQARIKDARIIRTLAYNARWNMSLKKARKSLRKCLKEIKKEGVPEGQNLEKFKKYDLDISMVFGFMEEVALGIQLGVLDEETAKNSLIEIVKILRNKFGDWLLERRKEYKSDDIYSEFSKLAAKWKV